MTLEDTPTSKYMASINSMVCEELMESLYALDPVVLTRIKVLCIVTVHTTVT
jgi:hypothetical protein